MRKRTCLILIMLTVLLCSACGLQTDLYMAYDNDIVVASVNGINIYYSEIQAKQSYNSLSVSYLEELIEKEEITSDPGSLVIKTKDQILEDIILDEVLLQYYRSDEGGGSDKIIKHGDAVAQSKQEMESYKTSGYSVAAEFGTKILNGYCDATKKNEAQWHEYNAKLIIRKSSAVKFKREYMEVYDFQQTLPDVMLDGERLLAWEEKVEQIMVNAKIERYAMP